MECLTDTVVEKSVKINTGQLLINMGKYRSHSASDGLQKAISLFPKISLEEMAQVKLMNRIDFKYLVHCDIIPLILMKIRCNYHIQEIDGRSLAEYGTTYLDTDDLQFFRMHMNCKLTRLKWRIRSYFGSYLSFLEIKKKTNKGRTQKKRVVYNPSQGYSEPITSDFIREESGMKSENLKPILQNCFNRITLVNKDKTERLTIDLNITYQNLLTGNSSDTGNLAVIEIKQDRTNNSDIRNYLDELRIKKTGISKYCLGLVLTDPCLKGNLYKRKIRYINKITAQK
jgi:hypothetical protein